MIHKIINNYKANMIMLNSLKLYQNRNISFNIHTPG